VKYETFVSNRSTLSRHLHSSDSEQPSKMDNYADDNQTYGFNSSGTFQVVTPLELLKRYCLKVKPVKSFDTLWFL